MNFKLKYVVDLVYLVNWLLLLMFFDYRVYVFNDAKLCISYFCETEKWIVYVWNEINIDYDNNYDFSFRNGHKLWLCF